MAEWRPWLRRGICAVLIVLAVYWLFSSGDIRHPPGVLVPEEPLQVMLQDRKPWTRNGCQITPLAEFDIRARVLSKARYYMGRETELSPLDLVLGWGPLSDQEVVDKLSISQSGRWFEWRARKLPLPPSEVACHCANMHMIPATPAVESALSSLRRGSIVRLQGYLVAVEGSNGWKWRSSLARDDGGNGSCEIVWVRSVEDLTCNHP
ncbi:MAG: hypothetical protein NTW87_22505 [Planctomycetota bacterium]|nr:hypothetical protein [Planctomycetota bacterium]